MAQTNPRSGGDEAERSANPQTRQRQLTASAEVPERPALAPNVQLVGEMQGTGFEDRQWLIQRDGQFLQITELLYRVAEQVNGERRLEEIAAGVTESTDWMVEADHVRRLIQTKLIPLGLIVPADGSLISTAEDQSRSPLMLMARKTVLGPRPIELMTGLLKVLYAPPVLIPVLILVALAHGWLYFVHGVARSFLEVLYTPGLLLVVLAIVLVSGIFHEFGHASALRYGGGKARGMGVGIYTIYPAFYTDVTDSYRLGRWARVRTDLGGFYFSLIFALGIMALYLSSGQEFLLFIVVLIDLSILYQCLPFVRFDGYWALADLTGIPDLFSQIGPFLRSVLPVWDGEGSRLPALKPWVKAVFASYIVLTVPVLGFLLFLFVSNVPVILAVMGDSFLSQVADFSVALSNGDVLGMAMPSSQMIILALDMLGISYLFYALGRKVIGGLWKWSKPTPGRRVAGALIAAGTIAGVAFLWTPDDLSFLSRGAPAGVQGFEVTERAHVEGPVSYTQTPPVGGDHAPVWQNCGFYSTPVADENAVHSMEHGAVWIAYRPDLSEEQVDAVRRLAQRQNFLLASPYPDLPAPVVASAWGHQLRLDSVDDPRLGQFVRAFRLGSQTPEPGAPCTGGTGTPE